LKTLYKFKSLEFILHHAVNLLGKKRAFILKNKNLRDISPLSKFKDKMLEADSNLQRSITLFQGIEKMLALYKLYERRM